METNKELRNKIIIDLDSLFDTRAALMLFLDLQNNTMNALPILLDKEYQSRESDSWLAEKLGIPYDNWKMLWERRGQLDILPLATQTRSIIAVIESITQAVNEQIKPVNGLSYDLFINTYPYRLSQEEEESLIEGIVEQAVIFGEVTIGRMEPAKLTPQYLKENAEMLWLYDISEWTDHHLSWLVENPRPSIQVVTPRLLKPIDETQLTKEDKDVLKEVDKFEMTIASLSLFFSLEMIDIGFYNVTREKLAEILSE